MNEQLNLIMKDYLIRLEQLRGKALTARKELVDCYHYDISHDYRITVFEQIDRVLIYHDINIVLFLRYIINPQYVSELFNTSKNDSNRIAIDYLQRTKHALIIFIQSVIESYYRAVCTAFSIKESFSFSKVFDALFNQFNLSKDCNWYKANAILAKIRNTLHNNGIHTHPNELINYRGKQYNFYLNLPHQAAGYDDIICIIDDLIDFLYYIGKESSKIQLIDNKGCVDNFRKEQ